MLQNYSLTLHRAVRPFVGNTGKNFSEDVSMLLVRLSLANQLDNFCLVPVPRASHWLAMVLYGSGDVDTDDPAT